MSGLPADGFGLAALVFLLGLRHGFDPDHLVAINGLTRCNQNDTRGRCGLYFSLGHGVVVTLVGLAVALAATEWQAPGWLRELGAWTSVGVLLVLALANFIMLFRTASDSAVPLVGIRSRWFAKQLARNSHPIFIASIGAAFAVSFDTVTHALAFSLTGAAMAGWLFATLLGLVFTLGMVLTDALNGWWVARMVLGADRRALRVSRAMSLAIGVLCLAIAASALAKLELAKPLLSVGSIVVVILGYLLAGRSANAGGNSRHGSRSGTVENATR
jgi:nickel/cobalt transporter (NiCoT) family protein